MTTKIEKSRRMELRWEVGNRQLPEIPLKRPHGSYCMAHACFNCRKSFKQAYSEAEATCPQCARKLHDMGRSFKAPKANDAEQWEKVKPLWLAGFRFFSYRSYPAQNLSRSG
ncbi:hypothetical protein [Pelagibius sp. Alg239-R121]|uniref:hypothetical protein n=1 Tax=Pelagibius sp. Alg239-R121 TaxID=2993448 RepID=UPI0024A68CA6|nr:hypothetical protein [Pelagibius sp. Alg239-R121]